MVNKAVILARGLGTRMQKQAEDVILDKKNKELSDGGLKGMILFSDRPFLDYVISKLLRAGFNDICLIIGPEHKIIKKYYSKISKINKGKFKVSFAIQEKPLGTGNAVLAAEKFAGEDEFIVINSDNLYGEGALSIVRNNQERFCMAVYELETLIKKSNIEEERKKRFGIVVFNDKKLIKIVEKPENPEEYSVNGKIYVNGQIFKFGKEIFDACRNVKKSALGEYFLVDAVTDLINKKGIDIYVHPVDEGFLDLTSKKDIDTVKRFLEKEKLEF
jgi:glucose-1-phosphate thymidylyltransferase